MKLLVLLIALVLTACSGSVMGQVATPTPVVYQTVNQSTPTRERFVVRDRQNVGSLTVYVVEDTNGPACLYYASSGQGIVLTLAPFTACGSVR